jgi:hypothetical protein
MSGSASFDADYTGPRQFTEEWKDFGAAQRPPRDHDSVIVDGVDLKYVLGEIEPDRSNLRRSRS